MLQSARAISLEDDFFFMTGSFTYLSQNKVGATLRGIFYSAPERGVENRSIHRATTER